MGTYSASDKRRLVQAALREAFALIAEAPDDHIDRILDTEYALISSDHDVRDGQMNIMIVPVAFADGTMRVQITDMVGTAGLPEGGAVFKTLLTDVIR